MKKLLLIVLFFVVGCSNKLECTYENKSTKYVEKQSVIIKFNENSPKSMETTLAFISDDEEMFSMLKSNIESVKNNLDSDISGKVEEKDNSISLIISKKIDKDEKVVDGTNDYEGIKSYFIDKGYTCK